MTPATLDPDLIPTHPADRVPELNLNPAPDLTNPAVLIPLLEISAEGMAMESDSANPHSHQTGCSNPSYLFANVSRQLHAAAVMLKKQQAAAPPTSVPLEPPPPTVPPTPEPAKAPEPAKPKKS